MKFEGTLNQIQLSAKRMMDLEAQQHLKDCLFHGGCKHIHNSLWYLYSAPGTLYLQLMVATWKVESEDEETREKVMVRATVTIDPVEGIAELSKQIDKLMAAMTQTGQGNSPSSTPSSPQEHGCGLGHSGRSTPSYSNSCNGRDGPGQMTPAHSLPWSGGRRHREPWQ